MEQFGVWEAEESFNETVTAYLRLDEFGKNAVERLIGAEMVRYREQNTLLSESSFSVSIRLKKDVKDDAERK